MALLAYNTNVVSLKGLRDVVTGAFVNDAVMTVSVYDTNNLERFDAGSAVPIAGAANISMNYKSGSNGEYYGIVAQSVQLTVGTNVLVRVVCSNYGIVRTAVVPVEMG